MQTMTIIEDERLLGSELKRRFEREGWQVTLSETLADARHLIIDLGLTPTVVLSDMNLPDGNGLDFLEEVREAGVLGEWIFLSGYGTRRDIERAAELGALDFLAKPIDYHKLDLTIAAGARGARARQRIADSTETEARKFAPEAFIGTSPAAARVRAMLGQLAQVPISSVLLSGETGTGKGLAAKILHYSGPRSDGPFVDVNCAAFPKDLLESQLFGHESGAFTGARSRHRGLLEQADGGTLFLDEIGEMDLGLQSKLLKALEDQRFRRVGGEREIEVDVQLVAASNRDLRDLAAQERFRSDLYHRISVFEIPLPSLRERKEDIEPLVHALIRDFNAQAGKQVRTVPEAVWGALHAYHWPGNVRELRNVIERCVLLSSGAELPAEWLGLAQAAAPDPAATQAAGDWIRLPLDGSMALDEMDRFIIRTALERHDYNVMATARALGTTRETLRYRIQKYGLSAAEHRR
ncbi:sigma-54-dependent Fis family transcriptional regulator [Nitrogeniibacter mangrovi]|uniref:Sigma-54-dependent Fis family transcriptional regulator n=1 Tax=Nitrogeniibacter mangrovi TaxID=2016596 RepID=A0A6C1AYH1_9RHOO|nr:sigma-54 dependent transcriptional regulator [Nitrogeniibacter mangrovi]QID16412.1 sigma-54-dependent Fis family transcriptional regulator [Nitrogeniibacter mangrovi]